MEAFQAYGSAYRRSQMFPLLRPIICDASDHSVGALMKQKLRRLAVVRGTFFSKKLNPVQRLQLRVGNYMSDYPI
ncbi:hypothetical protein J6590_087899 [Homalodisca vitripennis]|nr:hypothetical protein J6590_087899 [Homalodisca vitripennis]